MHDRVDLFRDVSGAALLDASSPLHTCALAASHLAHIDQADADDWLHRGCAVVGAALPGSTTVTAALFSVEPRGAIAGARWAGAWGADDDARRALLEHIRRGMPLDVRLHADLRTLLRAPQCARPDNTDDDAGRRGPYRKHLAAAGAHEYVRATIPIQHHDGAAVFILQAADAPDSSHHDDDDTLDRLRCLAPVFCRSFCARILAREDARKRLLGRISAVQQRMVPPLCAGLSEAEIARRIDRSQHTVHGHIKAIYRAWGVGSRHELKALWDGRHP